MEYIELNHKTTYNYISSLANTHFRSGAKICPTTAVTTTQPQCHCHCYTMHVLRNTDYGSAAHRKPNVEQIPIRYDFYYSGWDYIGKMLDEFGLINMNGRCYDPVVGRFLSPDIIVQNSNNTQCYNRYSYAVNNPLKYTDPSGWSWTPIDAARHTSMIANTMMMHLQDKFHPSIIRSGSSSRGSGYLFGSNAIIFQNAEATLQMALGDIAHILSSVFGMPGVFGNPVGGDVHCWIDYVSKSKIEGDYNELPIELGASNTPYQLPVTLLPGVEVMSKKVSASSYEELQTAVINQLNEIEVNYELSSGILLTAGIIGIHDFSNLLETTGEFPSLKAIGKIISVAVMVYTGYEAYNSWNMYRETNDIGYLAGSINKIGIEALSFAGYLGPYINLIGGSFDAEGGFNGVYNYFSRQQFFWNNYGFMVLPNGTPILK